MFCKPGTNLRIPFLEYIPTWNFDTALLWRLFVFTYAFECTLHVLVDRTLSVYDVNPWQVKAHISSLLRY